MDIRHTSADDVVALAHHGWNLMPHAWRERGHSLIAERDGVIVAAAMRAPNRVHPTRDTGWLFLREPGDVVPLLTALRQADPAPMSFQATVDTNEHQALLRAGAQPYQHCPAQLVDSNDLDVVTWCERHLLLDVESLAHYDDQLLTDLWTTYYEILHQPWAPTADHDALMVEFATLVEELDRERSYYVTEQGFPVAVCFVFPADSFNEVIVEAVYPEHAWAREAVGSLMARALLDAGGDVMFDGHVSDPHFFPLLQGIPHVREGDGCPMDLLEF